jgi:hypothetical protein
MIEVTVSQKDQFEQTWLASGAFQFLDKCLPVIWTPRVYQHESRAGIIEIAIHFSHPKWQGQADAFDFFGHIFTFDLIDPIRTITYRGKM